MRLKQFSTRNISLCYSTVPPRVRDKHSNSELRAAAAPLINVLSSASKWVRAHACMYTLCQSPPALRGVISQAIIIHDQLSCRDIQIHTWVRTKTRRSTSRNTCALTTRSLGGAEVWYTSGSIQLPIFFMNVAKIARNFPQSVSALHKEPPGQNTFLTYDAAINWSHKDIISPFKHPCVGNILHTQACTQAQKKSRLNRNVSRSSLCVHPSVLVWYWLFPVLKASCFTVRQRHRWPSHLSVMVCDWHDCCVVSVSLSAASFYSTATSLILPISVCFLRLVF